MTMDNPPVVAKASMDWETVAELVLRYGIPFTDKMINLWANKSPVTVEEWGTLKALGANNAKSQMLDALSRAGIDPNSPQGLALLAQVPQ